MNVLFSLLLPFACDKASGANSCLRSSLEQLEFNVGIRALYAAIENMRGTLGTPMRPGAEKRLRETIASLSEIIQGFHSKFGTYWTSRMQEEYRGENFKKIHYFTENELQQHRIQILNGRVTDGLGRPWDTSSAHRVELYPRAIFVMDEEGNIVIFNHHAEGLFHHSSFLKGGPVAAAGTIQIEQGKVIFIDLNSGHYKQTPEYLVQVLSRLRSLGADLRECDVQFRDGILRPHIINPFQE